MQRSCRVTHVKLESHLSHETERRLSTRPNCGVNQVGLDYLDLTLESHTTVAMVLVMEVASAMAVKAVLFVRKDGEHRNATADQRRRVCSKTRIPHMIQDLLQSVSIQKFVSV